MRPVAVQAVRFEPGNGAQVAAWCGGEFRQGYGKGSRFMIDIRTAAGTVTAYPGDWVIRGSRASFIPAAIRSSSTPTRRSPMTPDKLARPAGRAWRVRAGSQTACGPAADPAGASRGAAAD
jgi:hypothetical protein